MISERLATTFRLCSTIRMVYFAEMRLISAAILSMSSCPMPAIGSSSSIISGSSASVVALAPVRHLDRRRRRKLAQANIVEQFMGAAVEAVEHRFGTPEIEGVPVLTL